MSLPLFTRDREDQEDAYRHLRDSDWNAELRAFAEALWDRFQPYAEPEFRDELSRAFHQRFWEMYLGCGLLNAGIAPLPTSTAGPDFKIEHQTKTIWIEATAPTAGTGVDAVPDYTSKEARWVPTEQILLRLRSAIETKHEKFLEYRDSGMVSHNDCLVIAINGGCIPLSILESDPPRIISALFPIGSQYATIDRNTLEVTGTGFHYRDHLKKQSGNKVETTIFTSDAYSAISAVLYSNSDAGNHPERIDQIGQDFTVIYNPHAINPLPRGVLPSGREYLVEDEQLVSYETRP